jgi:hypothetical protein
LLGWRSGGSVEKGFDPAGVSLSMSYNSNAVLFLYYDVTKGRYWFVVILVGVKFEDGE